VTAARKPNPLSTFQILTFAWMSVLVVIGVALTVVLAGESSQDGSAPLWPYLVVLAVAAPAGAMIELVGYRVRPLPPTTSAEQAFSQGVAMFQQSMMIRFALSESVAIVAIALTFIVSPTSITIYLLGAAISLALMATRVWPSRRNVERVQIQLDSAGASSNLLSIFP
jgi:hypothetical protein